MPPKEAEETTIFVIASVFPHRHDGLEGVSAVHIVVYEIIEALRQSHCRICIQVLTDEAARELDSAETAEMRQLQLDGFEVLPPLFVLGTRPSHVSLARRFAALFHETVTARLSEFYPSIQFSAAIQSRLVQSAADVVLTLWSPEGIAATHGCGIPRIAYHGDIDFGPWEARSTAPDLFPIQSPWPKAIARFLDRIRLKGFKRAHTRVMKDVRVIANVTASNARFYKAQGHPCSIYVPNTWTDATPSVVRPVRGPAPPYKIIGHAGYLDRTGSTLGLDYLLRFLMPALDEALAGLDYSVHIIGSGEIASPLRPYLNHPRIVVRGFVEDLDKELETSDAFLMLNNAGAYRAAYTRHVIAWSLGLCLIAHSNSRDAIPEMENMYNCLMAESPAEMALMVRRCLTDPALNARIRSNGRRTFEELFRPQNIAAILKAKIDAVLT